MQSSAKQLALSEVFAEDSEHERTFDGFSDSDFDGDGRQSSPVEDEDLPEPSHKRKKTKSGAFSFTLRVALRHRPSSKQATDEEEDEHGGGAEDEMEKKRSGKSTQAKKIKRVKFELEEKAVSQPSPPKDHGSDSAEDVPGSFLAKREQNIKANKAMLAQLMADLHKMPGGAGFLKKQAEGQKTKEKRSGPPRSGGGSRKNPERASRRQTRSMSGVEHSPAAPKEEELEQCLEEELLEVRHAPRRRAAPRPSQGKPHTIRPVEDITEDELELVADNMTHKIYNSATGSTCHQCRQKTIDTKTCCRSEGCRGIQGQFCGPCLRNRYGEDVRKALLDPEWTCPPCRGICNCSFCRQRDGRCPTGILLPLAQYHGFSDVHSYLSSLRSKLKSDGGDDDDMEV